MKKKTYVYLFFAVLILSIFGLVMIYSSSYIWAEYKFNDPYKYVKQQGLFLIIGTFLMILMSKIDYLVYKEKDMNIIIIFNLLHVLITL